MDLLHYEFIEGPDASINGMLRKLVTEIRYNRSEVSAEQFKQAIPKLKQIENTLQELDDQLGQPIRNYIQEIMDELDEESDRETKIQDELFRGSRAIIDSFKNSDNFNFED